MYEIISQYLEYLELEKGLSQNTIDAYRRDLYSFADGGKSIEEIDRIYINNYTHLFFICQEKIVKNPKNFISLPR